MTLRDLSAGDRVYIDRITMQGGLGRRLLDLGMTRGASVKCLFSAPGGGLRAYLVRGAVIALRGEDAAMVRCKREANEWD